MLFHDTFYSDTIPMYRTHHSGGKSSFLHPNTVNSKLSLTGVVFFVTINILYLCFKWRVAS